MRRAYLGLIVAGVMLLAGGWWWKNQQTAPTPAPTISQATPLDRARARVTKKEFGKYYKDRFQGYHTGTDFEIFPEETNIPVSIHVICSGKLRLKEFASGYGGVVVQDCQWDNQPVTVIYGHLKLASVTKNLNEDLMAGDTIGVLGTAFSQETDGERRHLHLGVHWGTEIDIRGYVDSPKKLSAWVDPVAVLSPL